MRESRRTRLHKKRMRGPRSDDISCRDDSPAQALAAFAISQVHHGPRF